MALGIQNGNRLRKYFIRNMMVTNDEVYSFFFGGIRLEDDILITPEGSRFTGDKRIPITIDEVEAIMNE
jgi:Xaa-Pro aminopeptidase